MIALFALMCCCCAENQTWVAPDELTIGRLLFSAQNGDRVALNFFADGSFKLAIFDFQHEKAILVNDGRINPSTSFPIPWKQGFAVVNIVGGQAYQLGPEGEFLDKLAWDTFHGWESDYHLAYLSPMAEQGRAVATIKLKASDKYLLGIMDFEKKRVDIFFDKTLADDDLQIYWVWGQRGWLEIIPQTAAITLLDATTFKQLGRLNPAREPWKLKKKYRSGIYAKLLDLPITVDHTVYFKWLQFRDPSMQPYAEPQVRTLALRGDKAKAADLYVLGVYQGKTLAFSWDTEELTLSH